MRPATRRGSRENLAANIELGNYNMMMEQSPFFDVTKETNASSHRLFSQAFPDGFAWELPQLISGAPFIPSLVDDAVKQ